MDKKEVKAILMSLRNQENDSIVNYLLGKIDLFDETALQEAAQKVGGTKESVTEFFKNKIEEKQTHHSEEHKPINEMFSYGVSGNCIHLHLPVDLHDMLKEQGISKTMDTVNLSLLDAIEKITKLKDEGFYKFQGKDSIYMISPILLGNELRFLENMDFETTSYKKSQLKNEEFVNSNSEAKLATELFGEDKNVGIAKISFDKIKSQEWQDKKDAVKADFEKKGIVLRDNGAVTK